MKRYSEFDFNLSAQPAQVSVHHFGSPPGPDATLRPMTSRSTVTQPVGRDVVSDRGVETRPASPVRHHRDAADV